MLTNYSEVSVLRMLVTTAHIVHDYEDVTPAL